MFPDFIYATLWGFIGAFSLIIGGILGYYILLPKKILASLTIFAAGILSSAVCFEILFEAFEYGGIIPTIIGFFIGIVIFTLFDIIIHKLYVKTKTNRKNKDKKNNTFKNEKNNDDVDYSTENKENKSIANKNHFANDIKESIANSEDYLIEKSNNINNPLIKYLKNSLIDLYNHKIRKYHNRYQTESVTILFGVLLDSIPEALAIGLLIFVGGPISYALIISIFIVNLIESMNGSSNMRLGGWKKRSILSVWIIVTLVATLVATLSYIIFSNTDLHILAMALGVSAGALISIIADVTLPEAFNETHELTGLLMGLGFLLSFVLSHIMTH